MLSRATVLRLLIHVVATCSCFLAAEASNSSGRNSSYNLTMSNVISIQGCNRIFILAIESDVEGVNLSVLAVGDMDDYQKHTMIHLSGHRPPSDSDCGVTDRFRCKDHFIERDIALNSTTVFVPLQGALLLAKFVSNDTHLELQDHHLINMSRFNCSPINSFKILRSIYTICLNVEQSFLGLFEIRLNKDNLTRTVAIGPLTGTNYFNALTSSRLSEFVYVELYRFHFIYFAYENYLYYFEPLEHSLQYSGAFHRNCTSVKELVYIGDDTLLAYCRPGAAVYYNLAFEYWTHYKTYTGFGRPYICPDLSKRLNVYQSSGVIELQANAENENSNNRLELVGENFLSGDCFGGSSGHHFVYTDQIEGTFIIDLLTFNISQLTMQSCYNNNTNSCNTVYRLLDNYQLLVRQFGNRHNASNILNVFDIQNGFGIITELSGISENVNIVTILAESTDSCLMPPTTSPIYTTTSSTYSKTDIATTVLMTTNNVPNTQSQNSVDTDLIVIGALSASLLLVCLLLVATATVILAVTVTKWRAESRENKTGEEGQTVTLTSARKLPHEVECNSTDLKLHTDTPWDSCDKSAVKGQCTGSVKHYWSTETTV